MLDVTHRIFHKRLILALSEIFTNANRYRPRRESAQDQSPCREAAELE